MSEIRLQIRYAESLYILSKEKNILDSVYRDVCTIRDVCKDNREFEIVLKDPIIKPSLKKKIVVALFETVCQELTVKFLTLIINKRRELHLMGICEQFVCLYNKEHNIRQAHLVVSRQISPDSLEKVKKNLEEIVGGEIDLKVSTDPQIIGGFCLTADNKQYDASFKKKLTLLEKELI